MYGYTFSVSVVDNGTSGKTGTRSPSWLRARPTSRCSRPAVRSRSREATSSST